MNLSPFDPDAVKRQRRYHPCIRLRGVAIWVGERWLAGDRARARAVEAARAELAARTDSELTALAEARGAWPPATRGEGLRLYDGRLLNAWNGSY